MNTQHPRSPLQAKGDGFTLVELLVVVGIIAVLAALAFPALQSARRSASQTKSTAALKSVVQANAMFAADNEGNIATLRWTADKGANPYVGGSFWGRLQPYLFPMPRISNQKELAARIEPQLAKMFGADPLSLKGTIFEGPKIYEDGAGLPVPFAFNRYLYEWLRQGENDGWVKMQQLSKAASTIYATYGFAMFDEVDAGSYAELPQNGARPDNNIFYLPPNRTLAAFLDGRVEWVTAPIAEEMVKFEGAVQ